MKLINNIIKYGGTIVVLLASTVVVYSQSEEYDEFRSTHYRVISYVDYADGAEIARKMEGLLTLYTDYFRYNPDTLPNRLVVRSFATKRQYDNYLRRAINRSRSDFTYIHYKDSSRSELLVYPRDDFDISLAHQGFVQYIHSFIENPPFWLREGFATYIEESVFDRDFNTYIYRENLAWLPRLKAIMDGSYESPLSLNEMLTIDLNTARETVDIFYPQAWGMVTFLLKSEDKKINRLFWDSIRTLNPAATLEENNRLIREQVFSWMNDIDFSEEFIRYILDLRTFRELITDGVKLYLDEQLAEAQISFNEALVQRDDNFIPYYYLGLINYDQRNYTLAEHYYTEALSRGSQEALTFYALGVSAFSDERYDDARKYFDQSIALDPAYIQKAQELLGRIES